MPRYMVATGDETLGELIDRIAEDAAAVAPGLGRARAAELCDVMFRSRVVQTEACGRAAACRRVTGALWGCRVPPAGRVRPSVLMESDPYSLPRIFAAAAADIVAPAPSERDSLEERLAAVFQARIAPILYVNESCGCEAPCRSELTDPFARPLTPV